VLRREDCLSKKGAGGALFVSSAASLLMTTSTSRQKRSPVGFGYFWPDKRNSWQAEGLTEKGADNKNPEEN